VQALDSPATRRYREQGPELDVLVAVAPVLAAGSVLGCRTRRRYKGQRCYREYSPPGIPNAVNRHCSRFAEPGIYPRGSSRGITAVSTKKFD
jgi:hypothetical protein